jgi:hypothetical protein
VTSKIVQVYRTVTSGRAFFPGASTMVPKVTDSVHRRYTVNDVYTSSGSRFRVYRGTSTLCEYLSWMTATSLEPV